MEDDLTRRKSERSKPARRKTATAKASTGSDTIERRVHPRVPVSWPVRLWVNNDSAVAGGWVRG